MAKVQKTPSGCWEWQAGLRPNQSNMPYGGFWLGNRTRKAHVCALIIIRGVDPGEAHVLHSCDNPRCVNPDHLTIGDHAKNMAERSERGRTAGGARNGGAKLDDATVTSVRARHAAGESGASIARSLGIHTATACRIVRGDSWR